MTFRYHILRAWGIAIVVAMCMGVGLVIGGVHWIAGGAHGGDAGANLLVLPLCLGIVALLTNTPIACVAMREVEHWVAMLLLFALIAIPFWVVVYPVQVIGLRLGWIERGDVP